MKGSGVVTCLDVAQSNQDPTLATIPSLIPNQVRRLVMQFHAKMDVSAVKRGPRDTRVGKPDW